MKVKRIVEIEEYHIKELQEWCRGEHYGQLRFEIINSAFSSIAHSTPITEGDMISRSALKEAIEKYRPILLSSDYLKGTNNMIGYCIAEIDNATTVETICPYLSDNEVKQPCLQAPCERPQGEWKFTTHYARRYRVCPFCSAEKLDDSSEDWNYCWHCGADMKGGAE